MKSKSELIPVVSYLCQRVADALFGKKREMVHVGLGLHHCLVFAHCLFVPKKESRRQVGVKTATHWTSCHSCYPLCSVLGMWCLMYVKYDATSIHTGMGFACLFVRPESQRVLEGMRQSFSNWCNPCYSEGILYIIPTQTHAHTSALAWVPLQTGSACWAFWPACNGCSTACDRDRASGTRVPHCRSDGRITWCTKTNKTTRRL